MKNYTAQEWLREKYPVIYAEYAEFRESRKSARAKKYYQKLKQAYHEIKQEAGL